MKVNSVTSYNTYPKTSFCSDKKQNDVIQKSKEKQMKIANTKKVISECTTIAFGLTILYFAMKRNFMKNGVKNEAKKLMEQSKNRIPTFTVNPDLLKPFLQ